MTMMKETLSFLAAKGLQQNDRLGIVTFDSEIATPLRMTTMDASGRRAAKTAIDAINPRGTTNLSGGLLRSISLVTGRVDNPVTSARSCLPQSWRRWFKSIGWRAAAAAGTTTLKAPQVARAVLLFTDGQANGGITDKGKLIAAAATAVGEAAAAGAPVTLFTFGFGNNHNDALLRGLAERANGQYYYVNRADDIPLAFADALGGLVSVVAQNTTLTLRAVAGEATLGRPRCEYPVAMEGGAACTVTLGDLFSEDEKDVLLTLALPMLAQPRDGRAAAVHATLRFFSVAQKRVVEESATLEVARPASTPEGQPVSAKLEEQRVRVEMAAAMAKAQERADAGHVLEGRDMLQQAVLSAQAASVDTPLVPPARVELATS